jgi:predicted transcriptional regulator
MSQSTTTLLRIPQTQASFSPFNLDNLVHQKKKRVIRPRRMIVAAILDACRTPTVQHWIMVRARLGYDTFWKHMNDLVSRGMMNIVSEGSKTLYSVSDKGLSLLRELENSRI